MKTSVLPRMWAKVGRHLQLVVSILSVIALVTPDAAFAARRYWVGAYGGSDWHDILNWSLAEGGGGGAAVPTINDVAIFTRFNSGNVIRIKNSAVAGGIVMTPVFTGALRVGTSSLILGGTGARIGSGYLIIGTGAKLSSSGTWLQSGGVVFNERAAHQIRLSGSLIIKGAARFRYSGTLVFNSNNADQTLAFSGSPLNVKPATMAVGQHAFSGIILNNSAGTTADDLVISGSLLRLRRLTVTKGNFKLDGPNSSDNAAPSVPLSISGAITIADDSDATFSTDTNVRMSGSLSTGASGRFTQSGGTLLMNGITQNLDTAGIGSSIHSLTIDASSGVYLTGLALVTSTLTINASRVLSFNANTLYLTGGTIANSATIRENSGKLVHTGSAVFIATSDYNEDAEVKTGDTAYFTVTDSDENIDGTATDTITVTVALAGGDSETVTLSETAVASGIFRGSISATNNEATSGDGTLQTTTDRAMTLTYTDAQDGLIKTDTSILTAIQGTSSSNTNSGGGSSRSRGGGGGGGGGGIPGLAKPTKNTPKPQSRVPVATRKIAKKKLTVAERKAARIQKLKDMMARMEMRRSKRQAR